MTIKLPAHNDFKAGFGDPIWIAAADEILRRHNIRFRELQRAAQGENVVVSVDDRFLVKIYTPLKNGFHREKAGLEFADGLSSIPIPQIVDEGEIAGYHYLIMTQLGGTEMTRLEWLKLDDKTQRGFLIQLARGLKELHTADPTDFDFDWPEFLRIQLDSAVFKQQNDGGNPEWLRSMPAYIHEYSDLIPARAADAFQHGDVHFGNLKVRLDGDSLAPVGLFDFADSIKGFHEYEFVAIGVLIMQGQGDLQREFFRAYGYADSDIGESLYHRLWMLTMLYEYSSLRRYAERLGVNPMDYSLEELGRAIWSFV
ncbi:MAG: aminoglycoside phosphotransferase family protein [Acidobacteria bacterium]|nr:aminoglycoside phosphotransferase family protein [Acidobacteriota bacterium]